MTFAKVVIASEDWRTQNQTFGQFGNNTSKKIFHEVGFRFYRSNQTNMKINKK
jgi:hypothetical protein